MKIIILDGMFMLTVEEAHAYMARELGFPDYYGGNLDALWDELSTIGEPLLVRLIDVQSIHENLGEYGQTLIDTFLEAAQYSEQLVVDVIE